MEMNVKYYLHILNKKINKTQLFLLKTYNKLLYRKQAHTLTQTHTHSLYDKSNERQQSK